MSEYRAGECTLCSTVKFASQCNDSLCMSLSSVVFYGSHGCVQLLLKGLGLLCNTSLCV